MMQKILMAMMAVFATTTSALAAPPPPPTPQDINLAVTRDYIVPAYATFAAAAQEQKKIWEKACDGSGPLPIGTLKKAYAAASDAWSHVQHLNFGPVTLLLRRDRLYHWPERRNAVSRSLDTLLSAQDEEALKGRKFARVSVAAQGLPALERMIFTDRINQGPYACQLSKRIADNIAQMASGIAHAWQEELFPLVSQGKTHEIYFISMEELANKYFTEFLTGFQMVSDQKIALPMGTSVKKANHKKAESWRSARSGDIVRQNLAGLGEMADAFNEFLSPEDKAKAEDHMADLIKAADELPADFNQIVYDTPGREKMIAFRQQISQTRNALVEIYREKLGLSVGFNSLDGD